MKHKKKVKVVFVGGFKPTTKDGGVGGQIFACRSLVESSQLSHVEFVKIDTTAISIPAPPIYKRIPNLIRRFFFFLKELLVGRVDACLIFSSSGFSFVEKGFMVLIARFFNKKTIFAPRSGILIDELYNSRLLRFIARLVISKSDHVICQGNRWKEFYQKFSNKKSDYNKFIVIQNWIDIDKYNDINSTYADNKQTIEILYVGWLEAYKGVIDLIESASLLKNKFDFVIRILGSGSLKDELTQKVKEYDLGNQVKLEGWAGLEDKMAAFRSADMLVLPSHCEGFPNILLEAMASQIPVISTDVGGVNDLIINGQNGLLIPPHQPNRLASAIKKLAMNPELRNTLAINGRNTVINNNSIAHASKSIASLF